LTERTGRWSPWMPGLEHAGAGDASQPAHACSRAARCARIGGARPSIVPICRPRWPLSASVTCAPRRIPRRSQPTSMTAPPRPAATPAPRIARDRSRLDVALVARGLAESREKAQSLIVAGLVSVDGRPAQKSAELIGPDAALAVVTSDGFVSRG